VERDVRNVNQYPLYGFIRYDVVQFGREVPTFRGNFRLHLQDKRITNKHVVFTTVIIVRHSAVWNKERSLV